ncbi:MAG: hypothetical protein LIO96_12760 [Lachnospiraceae bacterium]|nr:hypothetical protein [Lachnospiraceae bacterium]
MAKETGEWIMYGLEWDDPLRIRSWRELINWINEIGFLPLFKNEIEGFSVEEHTFGPFWWSGNPAEDPWIWREIIARSGEVAYGKFFGKKSGFVSLSWFPAFANYRRDGYDFDARWEDELAGIRSKKIMDCFADGGDFMGVQLKKDARFGKGKEKNFDGVIADLQMQTYLTIKDFRRKVNKWGGEYGMPVCIYSRPEDVWGYGMVSSCYREDPEECRRKIYEQVRNNFSSATEKQLERVLR